MANLSDQLRELHKDDPDVASILDFYEEIEKIYQQTLEAIGVSTKHSPSIMNSSNVMISFRPSISSSDF